MPSVPTTLAATGLRARALPTTAWAHLLIVSLAVMCASSACAQAQTQTQAERDADFAARVPQPAPLEITEAPATPRPPLNPHPQHGIKVTGRLPAQMEAGLRLTYATTSRKRECVNMVSMFGKVIGGDPKIFDDHVEVRHVGDRMDATVYLDKFGPAECGWRLQGASLWLRKSTPYGPARVYNYVIDAERYDVPDSEPMCDTPKRPDGKGCDEARLRRLVNADESIPVVGLCRTTPPGSYKGARPGQECRDEFDNHTKMRHLVKPETRTATIDIYDLDNEPRPVGHGSKESK